MPDPALWLVDRVAGGIADADHSPGYWQGGMFILADNPDDEIALADRDYYRNLARAALAAMPQPAAQAAAASSSTGTHPKPRG